MAQAGNEVALSCSTPITPSTLEPIKCRSKVKLGQEATFCSSNDWTKWQIRNMVSNCSAIIPQRLYTIIVTNTVLVLN